jgi:hypothetical protein
MQAKVIIRKSQLIKFTGDVQDYYVMPIKEDTGEIHTLMFWKE